MQRAKLEHGQTTSEYIGIVAVLAIIFLVAAPALGAPPLGAMLVKGIRHGICKVSFGICNERDAREAGLSPCVTTSKVEGERVGAKIAFVSLEHGTALAVERRSDGTASVSFIKDFKGGAEAGIGLRLSPKIGTATATAGAGVQFTAGHSYEFPSYAAAQRFIKKFAEDETLLGEITSIFDLDDKKLPRASAKYYQGGLFGEAKAEYKAPDAKLPQTRKGKRKKDDKPGPLLGDGKAGVSAGAVLGRKVSGKRTSWYIKVDANISARLGTLIGSIQGNGTGSAVLEYTTDNDTPVEIKVIGTGAAGGEINFSPMDGLPELAKKLRKSTGSEVLDKVADHATKELTKTAKKKVKKKRGGTPGKAIEAQVSLDLTDQDNLKAVKDFLDIFRFRAPVDTIGDRVKAFGKKIDQQGKYDVRLMNTLASKSEKGGELALGAKLGGNYVKNKQTQTLTSAWSRTQGGPWRQREDCVESIRG